MRHVTRCEECGRFISMPQPYLTNTGSYSAWYICRTCLCFKMGVPPKDIKIVSLVEVLPAAAGRETWGE